MKKSKTKSILACAVLASVMAVSNVAGATATSLAGNGTDWVLSYDPETGAIHWGYKTEVGGKPAESKVEYGGGTAWGGYYCYDSLRSQYKWESGGKALGNASTAFGVGTNASGTGATAFGYSTSAKAKYTTAFGFQSIAEGNYSTAWGGCTTGGLGYIGGTAGGSGSTAFGMRTVAKEIGATAWGFASNANGNGSTAWGGYIVSNSDYKTGGYAVGKSSTAFGYESLAGGDNSLAALGGITGTWDGSFTYDVTYNKWNAKATYKSGGNNAVAIGQGAHAKLDNTVAIGQYAVTSDAVLTAVNYKLNSSDSSNMTFAGNVGATNTVVNEFAVGGGVETITPTEGDPYNVTHYNRITGVAAGNISETSTDAINGSQLYQVAEALKSASSGFGPDASGNLKWGNSTAASGGNATAWGASTAASGTDSTAWGYGTKANNNYSTAFGYQSTASGSRATAFGTSTTASGENATAFGYQSIASAYGATAWGGYYDTAYYKGGTASGKASTAFGRETTASDTVATAFGFKTTASGFGATAWGDETIANGSYSTAFGRSSKAGGENSLAALGGTTGLWNDKTYSGTDENNKGNNAVAIGFGAVAKANDSVAIGSYAQTGLVTKAIAGTKEVINEFAVGGGSDGTNKYYSQITGVANGVNEHDAATYGQLKTAAYISTDGNYVKGKTTPVTASAAIMTLDGQVKTNADAIATNTAAIGDATKGLTKEVNTLKTTVGGESSGLVKDVTALQTAVGGESSGLVKGVADNKAAIAERTIKALGNGEANLVLNDGKLTLTKTVNLTEAGSLTIGNSVLSNTGLAITGGPSLTTTGLTIGDGNTWTTSGLTATSGAFSGNVTVGGTLGVTGALTAGSFKVADKIYISSDGLNANSQKITNVLAPTADTDAANKKYVDDQITSGNALDVAYKTASKTEIDLAGEGGTTIHNVKDGAVNTDAATVGQIIKVVDDNLTMEAVTGDGAVGQKLSLKTALTGMESITFGSGQGAQVINAEKIARYDTYVTADGLNANSKVIKNVADGSVASGSKEAVNGGQLYTEQQARIAATTMSEVGKNYSANTSVTDAVKALDTALGKYDSTEMANNNYAKTGVVATDVKALDTAIGDMSGFATENTYAKSATVAANLTALDTAIAAINNSETGVLKQAQNYTDALENGQVKTNKEAIEAINNTETGILKKAKDYTDELANGQVKTNKEAIEAINTTIGDYTTVTETTYAKGLTIAGDVIEFDKALVEHTGKIADIYSKIGGGSSEGASNVYIGNGAVANNTSVAIGSGAKATGANTVSIGTGSEVTGANSIAVGNGHRITGKNSGTFGDPNKVYADNSYAYGNDNTLGVQGQETEHTNLHAVGNNNFIQGKDTFVLGSNVGTKDNPVVADNAVILGNGSAYGGKDTVSVGSVGNERKIVNVADGNVAEGSTDAVNGGQLWKVEQKIDENIQNEINTINNHIDRMGTRINKVGAGAAALAAMHPVYDEDSKLTFSAGLGSYRNEQAAAVGMFFRFSPRVMMNAGATVGNDNNMYNVGLNFALDRHVRGGLPSKAVMAKQLNSLTLENSALKEKLATMDAKMVQQGEQIAQLMAMIEELKNR